MKIILGEESHDAETFTYVIRIEIEGEWFILVDGKEIEERPGYNCIEFDESNEEQFLNWAKYLTLVKE